MATESIFHSIRLETKEEIENFAKALEEADAASTELGDISSLVYEVTKEELKEMFKAG